MAANTKQQSSPSDAEIRVTATYQRNEETVLVRSRLFAEATELGLIRQWARGAEDMGVSLSHLEIEVTA